MMGVKPQESEYSEFVEVDPTGRYGRYNEILGKGSSKTVYRAFDEYEGIEVAWNQVKLYDFLQSPEDLERLYCEIHLLKTLKHKNIMKFYTSWVDTSKRNINFVTEMFTSGTLRQYRQKHKRVNIRAVKHWCRQILKGLLYLHSHDPPVIHRDLKCDNIFINGNQGEVKIGDLGLAAILRKSHAAHCVGTPEFMAPEVYEEEYNELVDIYSFGMCILEMVTFEYPYSECTHPAQIYKKVISGTKPEALYRVKDPEVRQFVEKCLATASRRLSARELLKDPFLQIDHPGPLSGEGDVGTMCHLLWQPSFDLFHCNGSLITNGFCNGLQYQIEMENGWEENGWDYDAVADCSTHGMDLFNGQEDEPFANVDITIKGRRKDDGGIFLRLRITDKDGRVRNIYFPFDIEADTALSVAMEMVAELDITDHEVTRIAEMIDSEVSSLVPEWRPGPCILETPSFPPTAFCDNCASNVSSCGSLLDFLSLKNTGNLQIHCSNLECAAMHGRFEEITYQVEGSEQCVTEGAPVLSTSQSDGLDLCSQESRGSHTDEDGIDDRLSDLAAGDERVVHMNGLTHTSMDQAAGDERVIHMNGLTQTSMSKSLRDLYCNSNIKQCVYSNCPPNMSDDYENEIRQKLRWLKAKYQMDPREYKNQKLGGGSRRIHPSPDFGDEGCRVDNRDVYSSSIHQSLQSLDERWLKSFHLGAHGNPSRVPTSRPGSVAQRAEHCEVSTESSPESMFTAKSFYTGGALPPNSNSLARTKSLPVDAVEV